MPSQSLRDILSEKMKWKKTDAVTIIKKLGKDDAIYGLGDKPGCLNKRGYSYVNWNTDDPAPHVDSFKSLYKSIPVFYRAGR